MMNESLRSFHRLFVVIGIAVLLPCESNVWGQVSAMPSLQKEAGERFRLGVGVSDRIAEEPEKWELMTHHFSMATPENCMKPASVQPTPNEMRFERPDQFVDFAVGRGMQVVGHCLVWAKDDRTPDWFYKVGDRVATKDELLDRMQRYIRTVAGRYRGKIAMWDVVNEALDDGDPFLRPSGWVSACGEEFIDVAFRCAHEADPNALLIYNDYNNELPKKRAKMIQLIENLQKREVPLHAIGLQGHYELDKIPYEDIEETLKVARRLGLKVVVSELDIDVVMRGKWWAENGKYREELAKYDPYRDGCPEDVLKRQAEQYAKLFSLFTKYSDVILRVSFWNLHDGDSWLNYFPWQRVNHPLLFDRQQKPKPAFEAVLQALRQK